MSGGSGTDKSICKDLGPEIELEDEAAAPPLSQELPIFDSLPSAQRPSSSRGTAPGDGLGGPLSPGRGGSRGGKVTSGNGSAVAWSRLPPTISAEGAVVMPVRKECPATAPSVTLSLASKASGGEGGAGGGLSAGRMPSSLQMRREVHMRGLRLRAGIEAGPISCLLHGSSARAAYAGRALNRAARLMNAAAPGSVWASAAVWEAAQPSLQHDAWPGYAAQGKAPPVVVGTNLGLQVSSVLGLTHSH